MSQANSQPTKRHRKIKIALAICLALLLFLALFFFIYTGIYYPATVTAEEVTAQYNVVIAQQDDMLLCAPNDGSVPTTGYVFYPGGKVAAEAYLPYLAEVAQNGYLCLLLEVPFRLAILDMDAAGTAIQSHPEIEHWAVGGHSLGGVAAADFAGKNTDVVEGLVLLGAYPNSDLSQTTLAVTSITATHDKILNWQKQKEATAYLPPQTRYVSIEGGNHSQFGSYDHQSGDGEATVSAVEQRRQTAKATTQLLASL